MSDLTPERINQRIQEALDARASKDRGRAQATWVPDELARRRRSAEPTASGEWPVAPEIGGAPSRAGRFEILGLLGRGGMGQVLLAHDPELRRYVAVKVALKPEAVSEQQLVRLVAEAQTTSQLEHPNIVPVYDMGFTDAGEFYFVMKRVTGVPLSDVFGAIRAGDPGRWTRRRLLSVFVQVCQAVAYAHSRGVLHRDLKPSNVMLGEFGEVYVMDWGLARVMGADEARLDPAAIDRVPTDATALGSALGTPRYMSPEQIAGRHDQLDARSDLYSLGAILYEILAGEPAWEDEATRLRMTRSQESLRASPPPPTQRRPDLSIPDEISQVALRAMAPEPDERYPDAGALAEAVEAYLEGSARTAQALARLGEGRLLRDRLRALSEERARLHALVDRLEAEIPPWTPLGGKRPLLEAQDRLEQIEPEEAAAFSQMIAAAERALSHDPENPEVRAFLARAWWERYRDAEARGDRANQELFARQLEAYDSGEYLRRLRADGRLSLRTDPPGAEVWLQRYQRRGLVWPLEEPVLFGRTPLRDRPLPAGSYLLTLVHPGARDTRYPVLLRPGSRWDSGPAPVRLLSEAQIGPDFVYIPPGPYRSGGDKPDLLQLPEEDHQLEGFLMGRFPVTMQAYCDFLNALHAGAPEEAWRRVPRVLEGGEDTVRYWTRPAPGGRYEVPAADPHGDRWDARWPVFSISWDDAVACAAWAGARLPRELEWARAARGVDGRIFPWGSRFDATLCKNRQSRAGRPMPEPVGAYPHDVSVFGVRDVAGLVREWCGDESYNGDTLSRPVRGGAWSGSPRTCRLANRTSQERHGGAEYLGFRLARDLPE